MGRKQWEQTVASVPRQQLQVSQPSSSAVIPASGNEVIYLYAPAGSVGRVQTIFLDFPAIPGATSGTHRVHIGQSNGGGDFTIGESTFSSNLNFNTNSWYTANFGKIPADTASQIAVVKDILFDSAQGLRFLYYNETNAPTAGVRSLFISYVKFDAA